ncbi:hypothetical protein KIN20_007404 [Parelaphostrongylus tenuis]|uniref:Uncharacterized protein n=1 Tax=Parelaphostrongylus tenuis TaxID=148309 RepID=A0AAD5M830_PARTN|nr:hypothetical protein KIN20_007404 [Parelaphostrongylus tenuis]
MKATPCAYNFSMPNLSSPCESPDQISLYSNSEAKKNIPASMAKLPSDPFLISILATISTVFGCGVLPAGQGSTKTFTVSGFTLPVQMAFSFAPNVQARVPFIATKREGANRFVRRLVRQTIFDVLRHQARNALLPDAVIPAILGQLRIQISYIPLRCNIVASATEMIMAPNLNKQICLIADNTVTGICTVSQAARTCTAADEM